MSIIDEMTLDELAALHGAERALKKAKKFPIFNAKFFMETAKEETRKLREQQPTNKSDEKSNE